MPATARTIAEFLKSPAWSEGEKFIIRWQFNSLGLLSDFETALADAIKVADSDNLVRLSQGFPVEVGGFRAWSNGHLGQRLRAAGLDI